MTYENYKQHWQVFTGVVISIARLCSILLPGIGSLMLLAFPSRASETDAAEWRLSVRPSICVSYDSGQPCTMAMEVRWEADAQADVCLRDALDEPPLHCWENALQGSVEVSYSNTEDVLYQLVEQATDTVLAEAEIKVINRDLRSSRTRRRHVWSIL